MPAVLCGSFMSMGTSTRFGVTVAAVRERVDMRTCPPARMTASSLPVVESATSVTTSSSVETQHEEAGGQEEVERRGDGEEIERMRGDGEEMERKRGDVCVRVVVIAKGQKKVMMTHARTHTRTTHQCPLECRPGVGD